MIDVRALGLVAATVVMIAAGVAAGIRLAGALGALEGRARQRWWSYRHREQIAEHRQEHDRQHRQHIAEVAASYAGLPEGDPTRKRFEMVVAAMEQSDQARATEGATAIARQVLGSMAQITGGVFIQETVEAARYVVEMRGREPT